MAALLTLGLAQCKKDDPTPEGEKVSITLIPESGEKVDIIHGEHGKMTFNKYDTILVAYDGKFVGKLRYFNGYFINSGLAITPSDTPQKLYFYLCGNRQNQVKLTSGETESFTFSIADQSLSYAPLSFGVSDEYFNGAGTYHAEMHNKCGLVQFLHETNEIPDNAIMAVTGMKNKVTVDFSTPSNPDAASFNPFTYEKDDDGHIYLMNEPDNTAPNGVAYWAILPIQQVVTTATATAQGYVSSTFTVPAVTGNMYYKSVYVPELETPFFVPAQDHVFTGDNKKIVFSPGNLQYKGNETTYKWRFAENQWDYVGSTNTNVPSNEWIDLFGYGTWTGSTPNPTNVSTNDEDYPWDNDDFVKEDQLANTELRAYDWRTWTGYEMYLISLRNTKGIDGHDRVCFAKAKVNDVKGVILLPDDWQAVAYTLQSPNDKMAPFSSNIINLEQWAILQNRGAVFLPCASKRNHISFDQSLTYGYYWSKVSTDNKPCYAYFYNDGLDWYPSHYGGDPFDGMAVRLVRDWEPSGTTDHTIQVSAEPSEGGTVSGGGTFATGATCTVTATANTGYVFTYWTKNAAYYSDQSTVSFNVSSDASFVAHFAPETGYEITVTANPIAGGTASGGGSFDYGDHCTLEATPNDGYVFTCWTKGGVEVSNEQSYTFTVNTTTAGAYVANFALATGYVITVTAGEGGSATGGGSNLDYNSTCTLTATADPCYHFVNWTKVGGTEVYTTPTITIHVTESATYVANFAINTYTITAEASPSTVYGSVSGTGTYNCGETCTLVATPNSGYVFKNWTEGATVVGTDNNLTFVVSGHRNLTAHFEKPNFVFTVNADSKKVKFSPGNLQYQASTNTWRFAEHQWNFVGGSAAQGGNVYIGEEKCNNALISDDYAGWIDLFGYGTWTGSTPHPWTVTDNNPDYQWDNDDFTQENLLANVALQSFDWYTLSSAEMQYILNSRSQDIRYAMALVNGVRGIILLPDGWKASTFTLNQTNTAGGYFDTNTISEEEWTSILEPAGAVFLPNTFQRAMNSNDGWKITQVNTGRAFYWHSNQYMMAINTGSSSSLSIDYSNYKFGGYAVRLVRDAE